MVLRLFLHFFRSKSKFFSSGNSDEKFFQTPSSKRIPHLQRGVRKRNFFFPRGFDSYRFFAYGQREEKTLTILHLMAI
nr:MAG TPA: hypothetical protein [Caudoviricetes sp.]